MSDEGRRVFPMEAALGVVAGQGGAAVLDFMGYAVGRTVCDCCRPVLTPVVKGWLYSLNPAFTKAEFNENISFENWANDQKRALGDNVSVTPMGGKDLESVNALLDMLEGAKKTAEDKTAEAAEAVAAKEAAEAEAKALAPFQKKVTDAEAKAAKAEEKASALASEIAELKEKLAAFDGKVAIDEKEIEKSVKDIVSRAVGSIAAAGGVAAAADGAGGAEPAAFEDSSSASDSSGDVPDDFGFGASGANNDGFGF